MPNLRLSGTFIENENMHNLHYSQNMHSSIPATNPVPPIIPSPETDNIGCVNYVTDVEPIERCHVLNIDNVVTSAGVIPTLGQCVHPPPKAYKPYQRIYYWSHKYTRDHPEWPKVWCENAALARCSMPPKYIHARIRSKSKSEL